MYMWREDQMGRTSLAEPMPPYAPESLSHSNEGQREG
jgi:hypothetical protein